MWKWFFLAIVPLALLSAGAVWYLAKDMGDGLPLQTAEVEDSSATNQEKTSPTLAPDQKPRPQSPGPGWALSCKSGARDAGLSCRLSQAVVMKKSGRLLTRVTFLLPAAGQNPKLNIQVPLGVLISAGATIRVDESPPQGLRFSTCNRNGCYAETTLSPTFLASLRKGRQLVIEFKNLAEKTIKLPLSLGGFDEAYTKAQNA